MSGAPGLGRRRRWILVAVVLAVLQALAACSKSSPSGTPTDVAAPVGVIAIGHSGMTGEGTAEPPEPTLENSWATGTNPKVNSIYPRLAAVRPENKGHVANTASDGASASELQGQAEQALEQVAAPALVIIATIDNDIQCDDTDKKHIPEFGQDVRAALDAITKKSPQSRILLVTQAGRPSPAFVRELVAHDPNVKSELTGSGICDFYNPAGELVPAHFDTLTALIAAYEAEQKRVCAEYPQCHTDGGARAAYKDKLKNFAPDWNHLNIAGQAEEAKLIWPVVEKILGL